MKNRPLKISSHTMRAQFIREELKKLENLLGIPLRAIFYDPALSGKFQTPGLKGDATASRIEFVNTEGETVIYWVKIFSDSGEIPHAFAAVGVIEGDDFDLPEPPTIEPEKQAPPQAQKTAAQLAEEWKKRHDAREC